MPRRISRRRALAYTAITAFALLVVLELVLRLGLAAFVHSRAFFRPQVDPQAAVRFHETRGWTQADPGSFRGRRDVSRTKQPSAVRIICMGDSCTRGAGVAADQTYAAQLERILQLRSRAPIHEFEVLNAGVNGYQLLQIADFFESELVGYEPDVLIVYANAFDTSDKAIELDVTGDELPKRVERESRSVLVNTLREGLFALRSYHLLRRVIVPLRDAAPDVRPDAVAGRQSANLLRLRLACERIGARLLVAEYLVRCDGPGEPGVCIAPWNRTRSWEAEFVPLREAFLAAGKSPAELFLDDVHPTAAGHAIIARELARHL